MVYQSRVDINQKNKSGNIYKTSYNSQQKSEEIHWICCYKSLKTQKSGNMTMDQYLYIPFLGGWTSINPNYFHVNKKGVPWVLTHPCRIPTWQKRPLFFPFFPVLPGALRDLLDLSDGLLFVVRLGQILQLIAEVQGLRQPLENLEKPKKNAGIRYVGNPKGMIS